MNAIERNARVLLAQSVPRLLYIAVANNGKLVQKQRISENDTYISPGIHLPSAKTAAHQIVAS